MVKLSRNLGDCSKEHGTGNEAVLGSGVMCDIIGLCATVAVACVRVVSYIPESALGGGLEKGACTSLLANGDGAMLGLSAPGLPPTFCMPHALPCNYPP